MKKCPKFQRCSIPICPFDPDACFRNRIKGEDLCPYSLNRRDGDRKGKTTLIPNHLLEFIPVRNIKLLNVRNQHRWVAVNILNKPYGNQIQ